MEGEQINDDYFSIVLKHYKDIWNNKPNFYLFEKGPVEKLPYNFRVLEFSPNGNRKMWTYATCCMSQESDEFPVEVFIFSLKQDLGLIEILTALAFYHRNTKKIGLNHTVNFGKSWQHTSLCEFGLISLPYLDGPNFENLIISKTNKILKFYWIIPITYQEVMYKKEHGIVLLEKKFEETGLDYINPNRKSLF